MIWWRFSKHFQPLPVQCLPSCHTKQIPRLFMLRYFYFEVISLIFRSLFLRCPLRHPLPGSYWRHFRRRLRKSKFKDLYQKESYCRRKKRVKPLPVKTEERPFSAVERDRLRHLQMLQKKGNLQKKVWNFKETEGLPSSRLTNLSTSYTTG